MFNSKSLNLNASLLNKKEKSTRLESVSKNSFLHKCMNAVIWELEMFNLNT